jgi:hypothetical protein
MYNNAKRGKLVFCTRKILESRTYFTFAEVGRCGNYMA